MKATLEENDYSYVFVWTLNGQVAQLPSPPVHKIKKESHLLKILGSILKFSLKKKLGI